MRADADPAEERALWDRWRSAGDLGAREQLVSQHLEYARIVAASMYARRYHDEVAFEEYLQFARLGLLESMDRFDPTRGVLFRTFAGRRMHGAILNGIERLTEKQQQIAVRRRMRAETAQDAKELALEQAGCAAGEPRSAEQLLKFVSEAGIGLAVCWMLEGTGMVEDHDAMETLPFYRASALRQLRERLHAAVDALPTAERTVLRSHYLQDVPFEDIAASLQLTKGRISQIHKQALLRLRGMVGERADWSLTF